MTERSQASNPSSSRSWYLDPLVASQKREEFQRLITAWSRGGEDQLLFECLIRRFGMPWSVTVLKGFAGPFRGIPSNGEDQLLSRV